MHEDREEQDDRQRNADQPKKRTFSKTHDCILQLWGDNFEASEQFLIRNKHLPATYRMGERDLSMVGSVFLVSHLTQANASALIQRSQA
jgi:hypothetical protein